MRSKKIDLICVVLILILLTGTMAGCRRKIADKDGAALRYSYEDIEKKGLEGLFTLNEDDTFSPIPDNVPGFAGTAAEAASSRYLWYTDNGESFTELIPTVTPDTPIVIIYDDDSSMPDKSSWYLERYEPLGATIGAHVRLDPDKSMYLCEEGMLSGTSASKVLGSDETKGRDREHELVEVSGASVRLPISNVETSMDMLLGLTYGKKYTFKFLQGTKTKSINIVSDAYVFQSKELIPITAPYMQTEKGYFIINIPIGLEKGFYYISDRGFFYYDG